MWLQDVTPCDYRSQSDFWNVTIGIDNVTPAADALIVEAGTSPALVRLSKVWSQSFQGVNMHVNIVSSVPQSGWWSLSLQFLTQTWSPHSNFVILIMSIRSLLPLHNNSLQQWPPLMLSAQPNKATVTLVLFLALKQSSTCVVWLQSSVDNLDQDGSALRRCKINIEALLAVAKWWKCFKCSLKNQRWFHQWYHTQLLTLPPSFTRRSFSLAELRKAFRERGQKVQEENLDWPNFFLKEKISFWMSDHKKNGLLYCTKNYIFG